MLSIVKNTLLITIVIIVASILYAASLHQRVTNYQVPVLPEPIQSNIPKKVLLVFAHDDDYVDALGTIALMNDKGYEISYLCMTLRDHKVKAEVRERELSNACNILGIKDQVYAGFEMSRDVSPDSWKPVPYNKFNERFEIDKIEEVITNKIKEVQPSLIISLDNQFGGYGHPEHIVVAQAVVNVCKKFKNQEDFPVKHIFQSVFSKKRENIFMKDRSVYKMAKATYNVNGMALPNVSFNIYPYHNKKKEAFLAHASQHRILKKFFPAYHLIPSEVYFSVFDREYFRKLAVTNL